MLCKLALKIEEEGHGETAGIRWRRQTLACVHFLWCCYSEETPAAKFHA